MGVYQRCWRSSVPSVPVHLHAHPPWARDWEISHPSEIVNKDTALSSACCKALNASPSAPQQGSEGGRSCLRRACTCASCSLRARAWYILLSISLGLYVPGHTTCP